MSYNFNSGFTRIPNEIIDSSRLDPYQFQIFSIIVRKTDGWCKVEDGISLSQFEKIVTFKKCKIISTLKELEKMGLISKQIQFAQDTKTFSYSLYRISSTIVKEINNYSMENTEGVVCEEYKGSISQIQGVVCEEYKQKKLNTKETKTNNTEQLISEYLEIDSSITEQGKKEILEFVDYRKKIKKPIKTIAPIKAYIQTIRELISKGYKLEEIKELMYEREWQTIKAEWVIKMLKVDTSKEWHNG